MAIEAGKRYWAKAVKETFTRGESSKKGTPFVAFLMRTVATEDGYPGGEDVKCTLYVNERTADRVNTSLRLCGWKPGEALPGSLGSVLVEIKVVKDDYGIKADIIDPNYIPPTIAESEVTAFDARLLALIGAPPAVPKAAPTDMPFDLAKPVGSANVRNDEDIPF